MNFRYAVRLPRTLGKVNIQFYNNRRPHMSIGFKTPAKAHLEQGIQKKMWKKKKYPPKKTDSEKECVSLQNQKTSSGDGACQ